MRWSDLRHGLQPGHSERIFLLVSSREYTATFTEFPPSQNVGSLSLDQCWRISPAPRPVENDRRPAIDLT